MSRKNRKWCDCPYMAHMQQGRFMISSEFLNNCEQKARDHFQLPALRFAQRQVLHLLENHNAILATLPTGGGKTLLYALPAVIHKNPVLVISPLIALMRDQHQRMKNANIPSIVFTSDQNEEERKQNWSQLKSGNTKIIFSSPERFLLPSFIQILSRHTFSMIVIDEAHCVTAWGHQFRPEYSTMGTGIRALNAEKILAVTATASRETRKDIMEKIFPQPDIVQEYVTPPIAQHIYIHCERTFSVAAQWLKLLRILKKTQSPKTIVYFSSRRLCEESAQKLVQQNIHAIVYHAGLSKEHRKSAELYIRNSQKKLVICATTAFGLGVDVANITTVIVYGIPSSIEDFLQMIGRAGRSGESSCGVLLWNGSDLKKRQFHFSKTFPTSAKLKAQATKIFKHFQLHDSESALCFQSDLKRICLLENQEYEALLSCLRITDNLEDISPYETYVEIKFTNKMTLEGVLQSLPPGPTQRRMVIDYFADQTTENWQKRTQSKMVFLLRKIISETQLNHENIFKVLRYYENENILKFKAQTAEYSTDFFILKNSISLFQKNFSKYMKIRNRFYRSLQVLENLATAQYCRMENVLPFFAAQKISGGSIYNRQTCSQCDLCIKNFLRQNNVNNLSKQSPHENIYTDKFSVSDKLQEARHVHNETAMATHSESERRRTSDMRSEYVEWYNLFTKTGDL